MLLHQKYWDTVKLGGLMVLAIACAPLFLVGLPIRWYRARKHPEWPVENL